MYDEYVGHNVTTETKKFLFIQKKSAFTAFCLLTDRSAVKADYCFLILFILLYLHTDYQFCDNLPRRPLLSQVYQKKMPFVFLSNEVFQSLARIFVLPLAYARNLSEDKVPSYS